MPFGGDRLEDYLVESPFSLNTRISYMKFSVMISGQMTSFLCPLRVQYEFLRLYGYQKYVRIVGLLKVESETVRPRALRLFLDTNALKEAQSSNLCSLDFMDFESALADTLRSTKYTIERKSKESIYETAEIFDNLFWSFKSMDFVTVRGALIDFELRPSTLVFDGTKHWQETLMTQLHAQKRPNGRPKPAFVSESFLCTTSTLIVSRDIQEWTDTCRKMGLDYHEVQPEGIPVTVLGQSGNGSTVLLCHPSTIEHHLIGAMALRTTIKNLVLQITEAKRSENQIRRFIVDNLARKIPSFVVPLEYIQVAVVIIDDLASMQLGRSGPLSRIGLKFQQVFKDPWNTKPKGLSYEQLKACTDIDLSILGSAVDATVNIIGAPKNVLKRFKIFPHLVKKNAIEERVDKIFVGLRAPLPPSELIQRFSGKAVTQSMAQELARNHFKVLQTSFGSFVLQQADDLSSTYTTNVLETADHKCVICYDDVKNVAKFSITICGHVFCKDCCKLHFNSEWLLLKPKECPACRVPLLSGDAFFIEDDPKIVPTASSKQMALDNFYASMRTTANTVIWPESSENFIKHIVIQDLSLCSPVDLIKRYVASHNVSVHIFYTADQAAEMQAFANAF